MQWIATYKDGTVLRQFDVGKEMSSMHLDKDKLDKFRITESSGSTALQFNADSGILKFQNLDYQKLMCMKGKEKVTFIYDKEHECFKLDTKSHKLIDSIILRDEKDYFYIEFDQTGSFSINGQPFYMGYFLDGVDMPFVNQPPYTDFKYLVDANEDFYTTGGVPYKKTSYEVGYSVTLNKVHVFDDIEFSTSYTIIYDVVKGCIMLDCMIQCNKEVNGNLYMVMGGARTANPVSFMANEMKQLRRVLTLV